MLSTRDSYYRDHHHHKHPGLGHLTRSVSRVTSALSIASSVSQLFSFLVGCRGMISRGFGFVAFFVCVRASSVCIDLSCHSARDWLSILRTTYTTQNLQRKRRTDITEIVASILGSETRYLDKFFEVFLKISIKKFEAIPQKTASFLACFTP